MAFDSKMSLQLQREEAALARLINASLRELNLLRKLSLMPDSPFRPRTEYLGPDVGPVGDILKAQEAEAEVNKRLAPRSSAARQALVARRRIDLRRQRVFQPTGADLYLLVQFLQSVIQMCDHRSCPLIVGPPFA